jgi:1,4-alpha-glucan branching enzyme
MSLPSRPSSCRFLELFKAALFASLAMAGLALADAPPVSTHFSYSAPTATSVGVAGEFNNWQAAPMTKGDNGTWTVDLPLAPGTYGYKFMVNGNDWELDPGNRTKKNVGGIDNSSITVGAPAASGTADTSGTTAPTPETTPATSTTGTAAAATTGSATAPVDTTFIYSNSTAASVSLAGGFNSWKTDANPMHKDANGNWTVTLPLAPGSYQYKFFVDGAWLLDPVNNTQADDGTGNKNSVKVVGGDSK